MQHKWTNACKGDVKRASAISVLMDKHPALIDWMFREDKPELKASPGQILKRAGAFSTGEKILIQLALDIWSGDGATKILDLDRLDPGNFKNALSAIELMRGI